MGDAELPDGIPLVHDIDAKHLNQLQLEELLQFDQPFRRLETLTRLGDNSLDRDSAARTRKRTLRRIEEKALPFRAGMNPTNHPQSTDDGRAESPTPTHIFTNHHFE